VEAGEYSKPRGSILSDGDAMIIIVIIIIAVESQELHCCVEWRGAGLGINFQATSCATSS
jgi:hypothetical protein